MDKRIVYIVSNFPCYSETFILRELKELKRRGYNLYIFSLRKPQESIVQETSLEFLDFTHYPNFLNTIKILPWLFIEKVPEMWNITISIFSVFYRPDILIKNIITFLRTLSFLSLVSKIRPFHIHAHFSNFPAFSAYILSRFTGINFTFTAHAHGLFRDYPLLDKKINSSKKCICISEYNRNFILKKFPHIEESKIEVVRCGIEVERFAPQETLNFKEETVILSVGRLVPTKGFDTLIRACFLLKNKGLRLKCLIVGEGKYKNKYQRLRDNLGLKAQVYFLGPKREEELMKLYSECDFFVLPVRRISAGDIQDGIPVSLMEAMSLEKVVISSSLSGIPELIDDGINGFLVKPDDYQEIARIIIFLAKDLPQRIKIGKKAREKIKGQFSLKATVDRLEEIFNA